MTQLGLHKKILISFGFIFCIWLLGLLWFIQQIPQTKTEFSNNSADVIVVLTGGAGRLEYGLELLAEHNGKILFISGVGEKITVTELLRQVPGELRKKINEKDIVIGHQAENTIGNAQEIKEWLADSSYKNIILVTSNYHIPRSLLELSTTLPELSITTAPVITDDNTLFFSEYHKYLASKLRHLLVSTIDKK